MTRPLKTQSTSPVSLKEMSDGDMDYIAHQILSDFGASQTGTGTLSVNPGVTTGLTLIGTFSDTYRPYSIGAHPVGTDIVTSNYNFYQDLQSVVTLPVRPMKYVPGQGIKQQSDSDIQTHELSSALTRLINNGLGSYRLEPTTPTVGGTWTQIASITNTNAGSTNYTYLWRRTDQTEPPAIRPLKKESNYLKQMSDNEIKTLTALFRNYIVSSGIGKYAVQASAPTPGTWVQMGSAFSDIRQQVGNVSYTGNYVGNYLPTFTGFYAPSYIGYYAGTYAGAYAGGYARFYGGYLNGYYVGYYTGYYTGSYTGYYSGPSYAGTYTATSFTGYYASTYAGTYAGAYAGGYARFYGGYLNGYYTGYYTGYFTGYYTTNYAGSYATPGYTGTYTGYYTGLTVLGTTDTVSTVSLWIRTA